MSGFDWKAACITILIILMILVDLGGFMYYTGISLNAISLMNLVMASGVSVEFTSHLIKEYSVIKILEQPNISPRLTRATESLKNLGGTLFCGIHVTNFIGVMVLAFTESQIFQIYFFRMYLGIVIIDSTS